MKAAEGRGVKSIRTLYLTFQKVESKTELTE